MKIYYNFLDWLYERSDNMLYLRCLSFINPEFYPYIFTNLDWADDGRFHKLQVIWCRLRSHPYPVVWYSSGWEPDMTCTNCGEDLA